MDQCSARSSIKPEFITYIPKKEEECVREKRTAGPGLKKKKSGTLDLFYSSLNHMGQDSSGMH